MILIVVSLIIIARPCHGIDKDLVMTLIVVSIIIIDLVMTLIVISVIYRHCHDIDCYQYNSYRYSYDIIYCLLSFVMAMLL